MMERRKTPRQGGDIWSLQRYTKGSFFVQGESRMPIYEYECSECGRFEVIQKFSDKPLTQCPHCEEKGESKPVTKAVSASAFHLKGSGWYKTDYTSGSSSNSGGSTKAKSSKTESSSSSDSSSGDTAATPAPKKACGTGCGCH